jgi:hypothetical protein
MKIRRRADHELLQHPAKQVHLSRRVHQIDLGNTVVLGRSYPPQAPEMEPRAVPTKTGGEEVRKPRPHRQ